MALYGLGHKSLHDDIIKWKRFPRYWPFVCGIPSQGQASFDAFFDLRLDKRLRKQSRRRLFETPLRSLWRHWNNLNKMDAILPKKFLNSFCSIKFVVVGVKFQ